jgi:hypothetical protein
MLELLTRKYAKTAEYKAELAAEQRKKRDEERAELLKRRADINKRLDELEE